MPNTNCNAVLENDLLILDTGGIRRTYQWNRGNLISRSLSDVTRGLTVELVGSEPDLMLPGESWETTSEGQFESCWVKATSTHPAHLKAIVTCQLGELGVRRMFRLYEGCPAIACDLYLRGMARAKSWLTDSADPASLENIEAWTAAVIEGGPAPVMERLCLAERHLRLKAVQFYDVTDRRNNLVSERSVLPYRSPAHLNGNLLFISDVQRDLGLFILKEAPCSDVQLAWPGYDFSARHNLIEVAGLGLEPHDLGDEWVRGYGYVTGVSAADELSQLNALHSYQRLQRTAPGDRDEMIMLNTWGDRGQDTRIRESFAHAEIEAGARLGVTHFQLDDGWQSGQTSNSAFTGGSLQNIWERDDYWAPHPERFPEGLEPVRQHAVDKGIELCLWFNPSMDDSCAHWQQDAEQLIRIYREYGIRTFKIDGVDIPDKQADINFRRMLDTVTEATAGEVSFNLDCTARRRFGYHYLTRYGNLFVENRYTDWANYYPHTTLRNLWMLSRYVPTQFMQFEFLNVWRNRDKYAADDVLAPGQVPFEYAFAATMMAQPLAWFEASSLPEEAFEAAPAIKTYRQHMARIHAGHILPIGDEPSGFSWTGLQSMGDGEGYIAVYRESNAQNKAQLALWGLANQHLHLDAIIGQGKSFECETGTLGTCIFALPEPFSYCLYHYRVL